MGKKKSELIARIPLRLYEEDKDLYAQLLAFQETNNISSLNNAIKTLLSISFENVEHRSNKTSCNSLSTSESHNQQPEKKERPKIKIGTKV